MGGKNDFFQVAPEADEIVDALPVGNADDVLLDDGPSSSFSVT
jgi:hypothetical protein